MTIAADVPTNPRRHRQTMYQQHLNNLVRLVAQRPGLYGWEIWNYFATKHQLGRTDVTDLIKRAKKDRWIRADDFGCYFAIEKLES